MRQYKIDMTKDIPGSFIESRRSLQTGSYKGELYEIFSPDGFCMRYYDIVSFESGRIALESVSPFVLLTYTVSGRKYCRLGSDTLFSLNESEFNYLYIPDKNISFEWDAGEKLKFFELLLTPRLMMDLLPAGHPFCEYLKRDCGNCLMSINRNNLALTDGSLSVLYDIIDSPLTGEYKRLYVSGKLRELLAIDLNAYKEEERSQEELPDDTGLKPFEIEKMHHVRDIILTNLHNPCPISILAKLVGTNETYLKQHFKKVFGCTVCSYCRTARMEKAKLLLQEGTTASETAMLVGYEHPTHFTRAFKKYFAISPGKIKKPFFSS